MITGQPPQCSIPYIRIRKHNFGSPSEVYIQKVRKEKRMDQWACSENSSAKYKRKNIYSLHFSLIITYYDYMQEKIYTNTYYQKERIKKNEITLTSVCWIKLNLRFQLCRWNSIQFMPIKIKLFICALTLYDVLRLSRKVPLQKKITVDDVFVFASIKRLKLELLPVEMNVKLRRRKVVPSSAVVHIRRYLQW